MIATLAKIVRKALGKTRTHMQGPDWTIYFQDVDARRQVPVVLHIPTKVVVVDESKNAWLMSNKRLEKYAAKICGDIPWCEEIKKIEPGDRAAGLLRIALGSFKTAKTNMEDIYEIDGKYFMRDEAIVETGTATLKFHSYECMTVIN